MALRDNPFGEVRLPLLLSAAAALVVAFVAAVALLLSDRRETLQSHAYGVTRQVGDAVIAPVSGVLATPARWGGTGIDAVQQYFFAVSENRRLKAELQTARQWQNVAVALQDTNERYRALLGLRIEPPIPMVAARAVTDSRGPFANTRLVDAGSDQGVAVGNPVMSENGLVGRVIGVTKGVSRVLLLTDVASRTPVLVNRTNARAILTGDGGSNPKLDYLRGQNPVKENDQILTSGDGGVLPRGLPVGRAIKGLEGGWRVGLSADDGAIDFVRIMLFQDFRQLADVRALDALPVPPPSASGPAPALDVLPSPKPPQHSAASTAVVGPTPHALKPPTSIARPTRTAPRPAPAAPAPVPAVAADNADIPH